MKNNCQIVIRTRRTGFKTDQSKTLGFYFDTGHAGLTLIDQRGNETHFDFAAVLANKRYHHLSSNFARQASKLTLAVATIGGSLIGFNAASAFSDHVATNIMSSFTSAALFISATPIKAAKLKREGPDCLQEEGSYPKTDDRYQKVITEEAYKKLLDSLEDYQSNVHIIGYKNCVHKVKETLREHGIDLNSNIYDSPNRLRRELSVSNDFHGPS